MTDEEMVIVRQAYLDGMTREGIAPRPRLATRGRGRVYRRCNPQSGIYPVLRNAGEGKG